MTVDDSRRQEFQDASAAQLKDHLHIEKQYSQYSAIVSEENQGALGMDHDAKGQDRLTESSRSLTNIQIYKSV